MANMGTLRRRSLPMPTAILLGFAPFVVFALLSNVSLDLALWAAFATSFVVAIRDFAHSRLLRLLDVGSLLLFGLLSLYVGFVQQDIPVQMARLVVDGSLFALAVASILFRHPLTLAYAREQVPKEFWQSARFVFSNYLVTGAWSLAFALMAAADAIANKNKQLPVSLDVMVSLFVLAVAILFTARYPHYLRAHAARQQKNR